MDPGTDGRADAIESAIEASDRRLAAAIADRLALGAAARGIGSPVSPARDAASLRRLTRETGAPPDLVARLWRALSGDLWVARGLKAVYVAGGDHAQLLLGARGYFGFAVNLIEVLDIREALEKADGDTAVLACLPWPENAGPGQWWPILNENRFRSLSILAGWPSLPGEPNEAPKVAIVGRLPQEPSGDDDTLATAHDDAFGAERCLQMARLPGEVVARARSLALIRLREFVAEDDYRLDIARKAGLDGLRIVGLRPRP
jgi:hypothetical protein